MLHVIFVSAVLTLDGAVKLLFNSFGFHGVFGGCRGGLAFAENFMEKSYMLFIFVERGISPSFNISFHKCNVVFICITLNYHVSQDS